MLNSGAGRSDEQLLLPSHSGPVGGVTIDGKPGRLDSPNGVQREAGQSLQ